MYRRAPSWPRYAPPSLIAKNEYHSTSGSDSAISRAASRVPSASRTLRASSRVCAIGARLALLLPVVAERRVAIHDRLAEVLHCVARELGALRRVTRGAVQQRADQL